MERTDLRKVLAGSASPLLAGVAVSGARRPRRDREQARRRWRWKRAAGGSPALTPEQTGAGGAGSN
jgi:hypothetical protein